MNMIGFGPLISVTYLFVALLDKISGLCLTIIIMQLSMGKENKGYFGDSLDCPV